MYCSFISSDTNLSSVRNFMALPQKIGIFHLSAQAIGVFHSTLPKHGPKNSKRLVVFGRVVVSKRAAPIILADPVYSG
jgi:hypothetical protein